MNWHHSAALFIIVNDELISHKIKILCRLFVCFIIYIILLFAPSQLYTLI